MAKGNNILKDFKAPPTLGKSTLYNNWKKEIKIWEAFTSIPEEKRAPSIFMTLAGEAKEAVLNMDLEKLTAKDGVVNLIDTLDRMYLKDESSQAYEAYESFEKFYPFIDALTAEIQSCLSATNPVLKAFVIMNPVNIYREYNNDTQLHELCSIYGTAKVSETGELKPVIDKEKTLEERQSFFDSHITEKESYEQNLKQKCSDLRKKLEEKHKSGLSSTNISIKKAVQDDIDESVEKYLDCNRMNTANLLHYLLQKGYREIFLNMMTLLELAAICPQQLPRSSVGLVL